MYAILGTFARSERLQSIATFRVDEAQDFVVHVDAGSKAVIVIATRLDQERGSKRLIGSMDDAAKLFEGSLR